MFGRKKPEETAIAIRGKRFYAILGVPEDATSHEIHQAFLRICRDQHPDKTGSDTPSEFFLEAKHAHDILMDDLKRRVYDETGLDAEKDEDQVQAMELIRKTVESAIKDELAGANLLARVTTRLEGDRRTAQVEIRRLELQLERMQETATAINKRLSGPDSVKGLFAGIVAEQIEQITKEKLAMEETLETVQRALDELAGCRYEVEAEPKLLGRLASSPFYGAPR